MKIFIQKTQYLSDTFNSVSINDLNERTKSKTHSSSKENNDNNLVSFKHSNSIDKKNCTIQSSVEQNQNVSTVSTQSSYQKIPPRVTSGSLKWIVPYPESAIKRAQIRDYLERPQFIRKPFDAVFQRYIRCSLFQLFSNILWKSSDFIILVCCRKLDNHSSLIFIFFNSLEQTGHTDTRCTLQYR